MVGSPTNRTRDAVGQMLSQALDIAGAGRFGDFQRNFRLFQSGLGWGLFALKLAQFGFDVLQSLA